MPSPSENDCMVTFQQSLLQNWEWPLVWEGIAASLGVSLEALSRPEDVAAARRAASIGGRAAPMLLDPRHNLAHLQQHLQQAQ